jgi:hypothetical protein
MKDKIYALGGYDEGVAVILSEDLRPLCYAKLKHIVWGLRSTMKIDL